MIDTLVQEVRKKSCNSIVRQCSTMQVLDMTQSIGLNDVYVNVNILEAVSKYKRLKIADLLQKSNLDNFERCGLSTIAEERVPGLTAVENYSKLIVLGKPGAGKTTFLKYLAMQCILGNFQVDKVPIFITIKDFAENENKLPLLAYIIQLLKICAVTKQQALELMKHGKLMVLLDGLDEVKEEDSHCVLKELHQLSQQFYQNNFVVTCRIAGQEYTFDNFTEVEIADFDTQQICSFVTKWFSAIDPVQSTRFIQKIQENASIKELATNPLLLTLLCLMFQETADFPRNRLELYQEGLDLLLKKWDAQKNIERDWAYKKLSIHQKQDLLSQVAKLTFEQSKYFFKQQELEQYITDYLQNLSVNNTNLEIAPIGSLTVLKAIEIQHGLLVERARGIYSFSHLTFQEYFTARQIVNSSDPQALELALKQLVSRITEKRWYEVFLLTVGMLRKADYLLQLMQQEIEQLIAQDERLQTFLKWVQQKSCTVIVPYKITAIRAFYIALARTLILVSSSVGLEAALNLAGDTLELAFSLDSTFTIDCNVGTELVIDRILTLALARAISMTGECKLAVELVSGLNFSIKLAVEPELKRSLQSLKNQLPNLEANKEEFKQWWQANGQTWTEQLRAVMISQRNIGHNWQLSDQQRQTLRHYYNAHQLLIDCLNSDCYVTRTVRSQIEQTLFLLSRE